MQRVKKLFLVLIVLVLGVAIIVGGVIYQTISELPLGSFGREFAEILTKHSHERQGVRLEEGSLVKNQYLQEFYSILNQEKDLSEILGTSSFSYGKGLLGIRSEVVLPSFRWSECEDGPRCYQVPMSFDEIPAASWRALIEVEDGRFTGHKGLDWISILRAIWVDLKEMRAAQGGSTLTQQLVKNLFLIQEKTLARKIKEAILSVYIEQSFTKEQILQAYFNEVYWGHINGLRPKGLYAASVLYFGKPPQKLGQFEALILVAMLKGPSFYGPLKHMKRLRQRAELLAPKQGISPWGNESWRKWQKELSKRGPKVARVLPFLLKHFKKSSSVLSDLEYYSLARTALEIIDESGQGHKAAVKAYITSVDGKDSDFFYSKLERSWEKALEDEAHPMGSTLKPLLYSLFWDEPNIGPASEVSLKAIEMKLKSGIWSPKEGRRRFPEKTISINALRKSYNRPVIAHALDIGMKTLEKKLLPLVGSKYLKIPLNEYPSQLLGALELPLSNALELQRKALFAGCYEGHGTNASKLVLGALSEPGKTTLGAFSKDELSDGRFFGKTGTSNKGLDSLFVFATGRFTGIIWVGVEQERGSAPKNLFSGARTAYKVFKIMTPYSGSRPIDLECQ